MLQVYSIMRRWQLWIYRNRKTINLQNWKWKVIYTIFYIVAEAVFIAFWHFSLAWLKSRGYLFSGRIMSVESTRLSHEIIFSPYRCLIKEWAQLLYPTPVQRSLPYSLGHTQTPTRYFSLILLCIYYIIQNSPLMRKWFRSIPKYNFIQLSR